MSSRCCCSLDLGVDAVYIQSANALNAFQPTRTDTHTHRHPSRFKSNKQNDVCVCAAYTQMKDETSNNREWEKRMNNRSSNEIKKNGLKMHSEPLHTTFTHISLALAPARSCCISKHPNLYGQKKEVAKSSIEKYSLCMLLGKRRRRRQWTNIYM